MTDLVKWFRKAIRHNTLTFYKTRDKTNTPPLVCFIVVVLSLFLQQQESQ